MSNLYKFTHSVSIGLDLDEYRDVMGADDSVPVEQIEAEIRDWIIQSLKIPLNRAGLKSVVQIND